MIIGLTGLKGSGKDTVGAYLVKEFGFERKAFADPLKRSVAALFDIPFSEIDKLKDMLDNWIFLDMDGVLEPVSKMNFRTFLQRYGTEAHRDIFGKNFWVDLTLPVQGFYPGRAIVVTDVRFRNEAERVKYLDGIIIRIKRGSLEQHPHGVEGEPDVHESEIMDYPDLVDFTLYNDGTIEELFETVNQLLSNIDAKA
jgi:hypothetical protein